MCPAVAALLGRQILEHEISVEPHPSTASVRQRAAGSNEAIEVQGFEGLTRDCSARGVRGASAVKQDAIRSELLLAPPRRWEGARAFQREARSMGGHAVALE
eukprot:7639384-Alexandrium_andersonii.AAC.1